MLRCFRARGRSDDGETSSSSEDSLTTRRRPRKSVKTDQGASGIHRKQAKPASWPQWRDGGATSVRSGSSNSLDSASTACRVDTSGAVASLTAAPAASSAPPVGLPPVHARPGRNRDEPRRSSGERSIAAQLSTQQRRSHEPRRSVDPARQSYEPRPSYEPPTPVAPLPSPLQCHDTCDLAGRFTSLSFASRREPLTGNLRYRKIKDLNRGSVGFVQLARDTISGSTVAIKFVERDHPSLAGGLLLREIGNQRAANGHPHVVQLHEVFISQHHVAIAMDYCNGGDMSQYIEYVMVTEGQPVPEDRVRRLFQQLMSALDFCHKIGIANRDVKLDNLLLHHPPNGGPPSLKLCDFGLSKDEVESASKSSCGTPEYMAPEVLMGDNYQGASSDVWSAGVTLYTLVAGQFPFLKVEEEAGSAMERMAAMLPRIMRADYQPLPARISPECAHLVGRMLTADPAQRISVPDILAHPWVLQGMGALQRLNATLLSLVSPESEQPAAETAWPPRFQTNPLRTFPAAPGRHSFALESHQNGVAAAAGTAQQEPAARRGRAASLDMPRIGAAAANQIQLRAGGCRQSLAEIASMLAAAHAATAAANRRQHRSLDMQAHRAAAAAAMCRPAWQTEDSLSRTSM